MRRRFFRPFLAQQLAAVMAATLVVCPHMPSSIALAQVPSTVREATADIQGVHLFYLDTGGSGPPVILLHAATGFSGVWRDYQLAPLAAAGFRVIAYDRRGYGKSRVDAAAAPGTAADDLDALVRHLGIDRFHLVGTAAGGFVAADYALSFQKRLRSLVIANSLVGLEDEDYLAIGRRIRPSQFESLPPDFRELGPAYRAASAEGTTRWLAHVEASRPPGPRAAAQPTKNKKTLQAMESIAVPTLLIAGDADFYGPPPVMSLVAKRIKGSQFLTLREVGHSAFWEQPEAFNTAVLDFLRKH